MGQKCLACKRRSTSSVHLGAPPGRIWRTEPRCAICSREDGIWQAGRSIIATTITRASKPRRGGRSEPAPGRTVQRAAQRITYDRVRSGLDVADVVALIRQGVLATEEVNRAIPPRTLARRKSRDEPLTMEESDRIARLVRVVAQAARVFDDPALRSAWLRSANPALRGERPIDLAMTDMGARRVETVLNRIAWGDYS